MKALRPGQQELTLPLVAGELRRPSDFLSCLVGPSQSGEEIAPHIIEFIDRRPA